ncbi:WD40-repeat-containing domain protein [Lactifluus volemus]|nr:WD40-repeat-containing domain protein [Lactifluus volemus]
MPKEILGFYFDETKNRYFPLSSRSETKTEPPSRAAHPHVSEASSPPPTPPPPTLRQFPNVWHALQLSRLASCPRQRIAVIHQLMTAQLEATIAHQAIPVTICAGQTLTAFAAGTFDGHVWSTAGDCYGVLHTSDLSPANDFLSIPSDLLQHSWNRGYHLESWISSICSSGPRWVATSFGSTIVVHDLPSTRTVMLSPPRRLACDIWTSHLRDRRLVLGVRQRALLIQDVENLGDIGRLETQSDVFALHQEENLVYTGSRSGIIRRFDTRTRSPGLNILGDVFAKSNNSITYLNIIQDWRLLVSTIRGAIELFDVRYLRETRPFLTLPGHVNSYQPNLPHAITPTQDYLFAAGLDNRIRGWSLLTGETLSSCPHPTISSSSQTRAAGDHASPFSVKFGEKVTSLEVAQVGQELCLFATSGTKLHRFIFGGRFLHET